MYKLILPLVIAASTAVPASSMHVVVVTRDRVVIDYRCENYRSALEESPITRSVVRSGGHISWHGVGGVAPYTLVEQTTDASGNVCITLIDATGMMATGCGIMNERRLSVGVECDPLEDPTITPGLIIDSTMYKVPEPENKWNGKLPDVEPNADPNPKTNPKEPRTAGKDNKEKPGPAPRDPERKVERRVRDVDVRRPVVVRDRPVHDRNINERRPSVNERSRSVRSTYSESRSRTNNSNTSGGSNSPTRYVPSGTRAR